MQLPFHQQDCMLQVGTDRVHLHSGKTFPLCRHQLSAESYPVHDTRIRIILRRGAAI